MQFEILDNFTDFMTETATIFEVVGTLNTDTGDRITTFNLVDTVLNCAIFEGSSMLQTISEQFRAETDAVIIINPKNITVVILDSYRIDIAGKEYRVIHSNNIMEFDSVIAVAVKQQK